MGTFRITVKGRLQNQEWRNVFYGTHTTFEVDDFQDIVDELAAAYETMGDTDLVTAWSLYGVDIKDAPHSRESAHELYVNVGAVVVPPVLAAKT